VRELERLDPTNALGDCYAAHCLFAEGDVPGALQALSQASAKGRFADGHIEAMMSQYDYLLNEGIPDVTALGLSFFSPPDDHWITIKQMERQSLAQADALLAAGQYDEALQIAQDVTNLGGAISSSGRFFLNDVMGISMQKAGLTEQRLIYEAQANIAQVQEVDERLIAIDDRMSQMRTMGQAFEGAMESMTDDDLANFVDGVIVNGEFEAMQTVPEVDEALQQVREASEMEPQTDDSVIVSGQ